MFPLKPEECFAAYRFSRLNYLRGDVFEVAASCIHPTQRSVRNESVKHFMKAYEEGRTPDGFPAGIKVGGDIYLLDGHHRTAAQIALGYKTIKVRAVEVSPEEWEAEIQRLKEKG